MAAPVDGPHSVPEPDAPATVHCKLFSDEVSEHLCLLRKKELHLKGQFSCEGCDMDAIMSRQLKLMKEVLGIGPEKSDQHSAETR